MINEYLSFYKFSFVNFKQFLFLIKNQVDGEKKDSTAGNTNLSMAVSTSTQKNVVIGDTNQSSTTEVGAKATSSLESQKAQQTALQSVTSPQSTSKSIP